MRHPENCREEHMPKIGVLQVSEDVQFLSSIMNENISNSYHQRTQEHHTYQKAEFLYRQGRLLSENKLWLEDEEDSSKTQSGEG